MILSVIDFIRTSLLHWKHDDFDASVITQMLVLLYFEGGELIIRRDTGSVLIFEEVKWLNE